eukprot:gene3983-2835_t
MSSPMDVDSETATAEPVQMIDTAPYHVKPQPYPVESADVEARIKAIDAFLETHLRNFSVVCKLDLPDGDPAKSAQWELTLYSLTCTATIQLTLYHYARDNSLTLELQNVEEPQGHDSIAYVRLFEALQVAFSDTGAEKRTMRFQWPAASSSVYMSTLNYASLNCAGVSDGAFGASTMPPVDKILDPSIFNGPPKTKKRPTERMDQILSQLVQQCHNASKKDFVFCAPQSSAPSTAKAAASAATPESEIPEAEIPASAPVPGYRMIGEAMHAIECLRELYLRYEFDEEDTAAVVTALLEAMKRPDLPTTQRAMASALLDATITPTGKDAPRGQEDSVTGEIAYSASSSSREATQRTDAQLTAAAHEAPGVAPKISKPEKQPQIPTFDGPLITREFVATLPDNTTAEKTPATNSLAKLGEFLGISLDEFPTEEDVPPTAAASDSDKAMDVEEAAEVAESLCLPRHVCDALRPHRDEHMALLCESLEMLVSVEKATAAQVLDLVSLGGLVACLVRFAVAWSRSDSTVALDRRIGSGLQRYCDAVQLDGLKGNSGSGVGFAHSRLGAGHAAQLRSLLRVVQ